MLNEMSTRRHLAKGMMSGGIIAALLSRQQYRATAQPTGEVTLGEDQDAFDSALGSGTEVDGALLQYGSSESSEPVYYVRFTDGLADHIETDLTNLPGGGLPEDEANVGGSRFLPDDVEAVATFLGGNLQFSAHAFNMKVYHSTSLASNSGRSGNVLVVDEHGVAGDAAAAAPPPYERATVSMEARDVHTVTPSGETAVLGAPLDSWWAEFGKASASQRASHVQDPPLDPMYLGTVSRENTVREIDIVLEVGVPVTEAIEQVGLFLPSDAVLEQTYFAVPSPGGPIGLRFNLWALPSSGVSALSLLYVNEGEESGSVDRILMVMSDS